MSNTANSSHTIVITPRTDHVLQSRSGYIQPKKFNKTFSKVSHMIDDAICPICMDVITDPYVVLCKNACIQNVCKGCITDSKHFNCFSCKTDAVALPAGASVKNVLSKIDRECSGCKQMFITSKRSSALDKLKNHHKICPSILIICPNASRGCERMVLRSQLVKHITDECLHVTCKNYMGKIQNKHIGCDYTSNHENVLIHEEACYSTNETKKLVNDITHLLTVNNYDANVQHHASNYVTPQAKQTLHDMFTELSQ